MAIGDAPGIGAPNGTIYTVVVTREERRMNPVCGYNDVGVPNPGLYSIETRNYEEFSNGILIKSWTEDVEAFVRCEDTA